LHIRQYQRVSLYSTPETNARIVRVLHYPESRANAQVTPFLRFTSPFFKIRAPGLPEVRPSTISEPYNVV
jgi:hypothetical protein